MGNFLSTVIGSSNVITQSHSETPFLRSVCNYVREIITSGETCDFGNMGDGNCFEDSGVNSISQHSATNASINNDSLSSELLSLDSSQAFLSMLKTEDTPQSAINEFNILSPNERNLNDDSFHDCVSHFSANESLESSSYEATYTINRVIQHFQNPVCGDNSDNTSDSSIGTVWYDASTSHQTSELG